MSIILIKRELYDLKYLNFSIGQPYNLVIVLNIKGALLEDQFRTDLRKVQKKHPLLKVIVEGDEDGYNAGH